MIYVRCNKLHTNAANIVGFDDEKINQYTKDAPNSIAVEIMIKNKIVKERSKRLNEENVHVHKDRRNKQKSHFNFSFMWNLFLLF